MDDSRSELSRPTSREYDEIPYPSGPIRHSHPCHLATLPVLFGLTPPPPNNARVLELGCAAGGNLIPMAQDLPGSQFLGIDLSSRQIADGLEQLRRLPFDNIELRHQSIADVGSEVGKFDYIICHGVYSWVPRSIQDKILAIGREHLTERGILYVSYNTHPGWHLRGVVRDMMRYHVEPFSDPHEKIAQARSLLKFLVESAESSSEAYRALLRDEASILSDHSDSYLFHEHLEEVNEPLYFSEFMARAETAGLRYLAEAEFAMMLSENFEESTTAILREAPLVRQEQYMDFLRSRSFRCTLLCHQEVQPNRDVAARRLSGLHLSIGEPIDFTGHALPSTDPLECQVLGRSISTNAPVTKLALAQLSSVFPAAIPMTALCEHVLGSLPNGGESDENMLFGDLMAMFGKGILRAAVEPPSFLATPSARPLAAPLARDQAGCGLPVTNRLHVNVAPDVVSRWALQYLDGERTEADLIALLQTAVKRGKFQITDADRPINEIDQAMGAQIIRHALQTLAGDALLVA